MFIAANCSLSFVYCAIILYVSLLPHMYCFTMCVFLSSIPLIAALLARSQCPEVMLYPVKQPNHISPT